MSPKKVIRANDKKVEKYLVEGVQLLKLMENTAAEKEVARWSGRRSKQPVTSEIPRKQNDSAFDLLGIRTMLSLDRWAQS